MGGTTAPTEKCHVTGNVLATGAFVLGSSTGPKITWGYGSPEGTQTAPVGSLFLRADGEAGSTLYVKESGTDYDYTGWVAK